MTKRKSEGRAKVRGLDLEGRRFLNLAAAVRYSSMSRPSLMRLAEMGRLTIYRPCPGGSAIVIEKDELDRLIRQSRSKSGKTHYKAKPAVPAAC